MRRALAILVLAFLCVPALPQRSHRDPRAFSRVSSAEGLVKQAMEQFGEEKKIIERDLQVLAHIRNADAALVDPMQRAVALQSAYEQISEAARLNTDPVLSSGLSRVLGQIAEARRSPGSADFERLRSQMRNLALAPSSRLVVSKARGLQEETLGWIKVQELIAMHLRGLAETTGESLRVSQQEK